MAQSKQERSQIGDSLLWGMAPAFASPLVMIIADLNGAFMEGLATAQKEGADFLQRRIREDVVVTRQLLNCHSLADMHQAYAEYLQTAFQQYREQSDKVMKHSESSAQHVAEATATDAKAVERARH